MRCPALFKHWGSNPQSESQQSVETESTVTPDSSVSRIVSELRLESRGFLEVDRLVAALGIDDRDDPPGREETLERITSKCLRARDMLSR